MQPALLNDEYSDVPALVRADPRWQAAMQRRGVTDLERVQIDTWAPGLASALADDGARSRATDSWANLPDREQLLPRA